MTDGHAAFVGSVPANYDRFLGPLLFHAYADDLAARLPVADGMRVLEVACGTGIVSERLARRLAGRGTLVATDLNAAMIDEARARRGGAAIEWRPADGTALPFPDASFDAVVCQFGLMFFPDKAAGVREAWRVLRPGGRYLFNVWDAMERNPVIALTHETVASFFPADPPSFYAVPYRSPRRCRRALAPRCGGLRRRRVHAGRRARRESVGGRRGDRPARRQPHRGGHRAAPRGRARGGEGGADGAPRRAFRGPAVARTAPRPRLDGLAPLTAPVEATPAALRAGLRRGR